MRTILLLLCSAAAYAGSCPSTWSNGYTYCKAVVQNHSAVSTADQTDFRWVVFGTDTDLKTVGNGGFVQSASGFDIIFTSDQQGQHLLPFERAVWTATTGLYEFWIKRTLSIASDTTVYMFFGNSSVVSDQQSKSGTWGSSYGGVYHFGNGTSPDLTDSSGNGNNGTNHGATACAGKITGAACFAQASSQYVDLGNNSSLEITGAITIESWAKYTGTVPLDSTHYPVVVNSIDSMSQGGYGLLVHGASGGGIDQQIYYQSANTGTLPFITEGLSIVQNTVYSISATYDSSAGAFNAHLYTQFANRVSNFGMGAIAASTTNVTISKGNEAGLNQYWDGFIDELRISNVARSEGWVTTGYSNANDPGTFYTISAKIQNTPGGGGLRLYIFR